MVEFFNRLGSHTPGNEMTFRDIDHAIAEGPVLVGSPQQIIDKIGYFHEAFGHDLQSFSLPAMLPHRQVPDAAGVIDSSTADHVAADV
jgi:alkanesulfonate monooxygenase SsuD/methylene tetrahydromethanopterin reductase-like flavin-dependent oxidoreductase (luciferase family)